MPAFRMLVLAAALFSALAPSLAAEDDDIITRWYSMLVAANEDGLASLLADKVVIKLEDIGITQSKSEFLGTMGEWRIAIAGGGIRHRVEKTDGDVTTVLACYDFAENDILIRETFKIDGGADCRETRRPASPTIATPSERSLASLVGKNPIFGPLRSNRLAVGMVAARLAAPYIRGHPALHPGQSKTP